MGDNLEKRHFAWWFYFAYCLVAFAWGFWALAQVHTFPLLSFASATLDLFGIFGLFFYIQSKPFLNRLVWSVVAILSVCRLALVLYLSLKINSPWRGPAEQHAFIVGLIGPVATLPLLYALWSYAFLSRPLWRPARPDAG